MKSPWIALPFSNSLNRNQTKIEFRRRSFATRLLVSVVAALIAFEPAVWAQTANSRLSLPAGTILLRPESQFSLVSALPDGGALDVYHNIVKQSGFRSDQAWSLYAARNTLVRNLLRTRLGLKQLISPQIGKLVGRKANYWVPNETRDLYIGPRGRASVSEFRELIRRIDTGEPQADVNLRMRLLRNLIVHAAKLVEYDQTLRYYHEDYWLDPGVAREFRKFVMGRGFAENCISMGMLRFGEEAMYQSGKECMKRKWIVAHGTDKTLARLGVFREALNQYPILSVDIYGTPFYQKIYQELSDGGLLPATKPLQKAEGPLPTGTAPLPPPRAFHAAMQEALNRFFLNDGEFLKLWSTISATEGHGGPLNRVNLHLERGLVSLMEENGNMLKDVSAPTQVEFVGQASGALALLALNPVLWEQAEREYGYLRMFGVDFKEGRKGVLARIDYRDAQHQKVKWMLIGTGFFFATLAVIGSDGAALPLVGRFFATAATEVSTVTSATSTSASAVTAIAEEQAATAAVSNAIMTARAANAGAEAAFSLSRTLMGASLIPAVVASALQFADSREIARLEAQLFYGTSGWRNEDGSFSHIGNYQRTLSTAEQASSDWRQLCLAVGLLGLDFMLLENLVLLRPAMMAGKTAAKAAAGRLLTQVGEWYNGVGPMVRTMGRFGELLADTTGMLLGFPVALAKQMMPLLDAVKIASSQLGIKLADAYLLLEQHAVMGPIFTGMRQRSIMVNLVKNMKASPTLIYRMLRDGIITFGVDYAAGREAIDDPDNNMWRVWINAWGGGVGTVLITGVTQGDRSNVFDKGMPLASRIKLFNTKGWGLFKAGFGTYLTINAAMEIAPAAWRGDSDLREVTVESMTNGLVAGTSFWVSSLWRAELYGKLQKNLDDLNGVSMLPGGPQPHKILADMFKSRASSEILMWDLSMENNLIGGVIYNAVFQRIPDALGVRHEPIWSMNASPEQRNLLKNPAVFVFDFLAK